LQPWKWRPFFALYWYRKMGRFREVGQICRRPILCANVFTGVFAIEKRFERFPALPEPHNLSKNESINYLAFGWAIGEVKYPLGAPRAVIRAEGVTGLPSAPGRLGYFCPQA